MDKDRVVEVLFMHSKKSYYFKTEIGDLKHGEVVIVETIGGLQRACISEYVDTDNLKDKFPTRWVLCRDRVLTGNIKSYNLKSKLAKLISDLDG